MGPWNDRFVVEALDAWRWEPIKFFDDQDPATDYAKLLERRGKHPRVRIVLERRRDGRVRRLVTYLGRERPTAPVAAVASDEAPAPTGPARLDPTIKDLACAGRVLLGAAVAFAAGAGLIAGLQMLR
jgi:hypothetical protein